MNSVKLKYFTVVLKDEDFVGKYGWPQPLDPIFNGLCRYCKENRIGDSYSMDPVNGFKVSGHNLKTMDYQMVFNIYSIKRDGRDFGKSVDEKWFRNQTNRNFEITMIEQLSSLL